MKLSFISNYLNHHQIPLSDALYGLLGEDYRFVATTPFNARRAALGYRDENRSRPYVLCSYDGGEALRQAERLAEESDVVVLGSAPERFGFLRMRRRKLLLRYVERPLKTERGAAGLLRFFANQHRLNPPLARNYLLCASAYAPLDFARIGLFRGRAFRWGYFPETRQYESEEALLAGKDPDSILWAGRLISWKHPEAAIELADRLRGSGCRFHVDMIGAGELEGRLKAEIERRGLGGSVRLLGAMPPEQVRGRMERAQIFLASADRNEGWGAVLNEAMNSGCAVAADHMIGAAPYLIRSGENGLLFRDGDADSMTAAVTRLLKNAGERDRLGAAAYRTIREQWNAGNAAGRLLALSESLLRGGDGRLFPDGVCSPAPVLRESFAGEERAL